MTARKALGNGRRWDIFQRDGFKCQYCGKSPPAVILHVDHIHPVSKGGGNEDENLLTACSDCNHGKHAKVIDAETVPRDYGAMAEDTHARAEQLEAWRLGRAALAEQESKMTDMVVEAIHCGRRYYHDVDDADRASIKRFAAEIGGDAVLDAAEIAGAARHIGDGKVFSYFCGICINRTKEARDA